MQNSQLPVKWFKAFAVDDGAKVEIPVTTADPTRASQSLGFPPLTMQPPESGGVPPQGEDFNGAMNQVARFVRWYMAGGALPFDNSWTTNAAIGGYPQGSAIAAADLLGQWLSTADNNSVNPDTTGTNWVPGYAYGATSKATTGGTTTLTPAEAIKPQLTITGALVSNATIVVPNWVKSWDVTNNTSGAFTVTIKTAAGAGVSVLQGSNATVNCDGSVCTFAGQSGATPTQFDVSTRYATAAFTRQTTGNRSGMISGLATLTMNNTHLGGHFNFNAGSPTATLPDWTSITQASAVAFSNTGAGNLTVSAFSGQNIATSTGPITSIVVPPGGSLVLSTIAGANAWFIEGGSVAAKYDTINFGGSLATNGYVRMPNGTIIEWGQATLPGSTTSLVVTLPLAFPTGGFIATASDTGFTSVAGASITSASQITVFASPYSIATGSIVAKSATAVINWIAIGR